MNESNETKATAPATDYRRQLDGLRFVAFVGIFFYHCDIGRFAVGRYGVPLFFALSGFLITRILLLADGAAPGQTLRTFYLRRTLRIFPLYYGVLAVLLTCGALAYPGWHLLHLNNFLAYRHGFPPLTGHFWSLSAEEQFYLLYPPLLLFTPPRRRWLVPVSLLSLTYAIKTADLCWQYPHPYLLPWFSGQPLVWGSLAAMWEVRRAPGPLLSKALVWLGIVGFFLVFWWAEGKPDFSLVSALLTLLVLGLWSSQAGLIVSVLSLPPLTYLGKISYGLYVFHLIVITKYPAIVHKLPALAKLPCWFSCFLLTILAATISWHLVEAPMNNLKHRFSYRGQSAPGHSPHGWWARVVAWYRGNMFTNGAAVRAG